MDSFDYIIVGAGSAGCVLANRLSKNAAVRVCLLEAGPPDHSPFLQIPISVMYAMKYRRFTTQFYSVPQKNMSDRSIHVPRGRTLGGTSSINGMIYIRGNSMDYDEWASLGNIGWSWQEVRPYFVKSENNENFDIGSLHGKGGYLNVRHLDNPNNLNSLYIEAAQSLQFPYNEDFNGLEQEGVGFYQSTTTKGRRNSAAKAFLEPIKERTNLEIITRTSVRKIIINQRKASGVLIEGEDGTNLISANREVILSAGSILSPFILMHSGVGNGKILKNHGINVVHSLPGVGQNLQDHVSCTLFTKSRSRLPYGISIPVIPKLAWWAFDYLVRRRGLFASNIMECGGFCKTSSDKDRPDIQHIFMPAFRQPPPNMLAYGHGYSLNMILLRPKSVGSITIVDTEPTSKPHIDLNMLASEKDLETMVSAMKMGRRILSSKTFQGMGAVEMRPGSRVNSDVEWIDYIRKNAQTVYHPVGTCKMGVDQMAVVDPRLKVHGLENLRVVDASVMPRIIGGNTNAPTIMIAEKAADMIKEDANGPG